MSPRCSVLTAVHDPERHHLDACLESVRRQTSTDLEHILVDDGSTRPYVQEVLQAAAAADPRVRVVTRPVSGGIVAASQDALAAASGEIVLLLDHDDVLEPDAVASMDAALADADVAYSDHDLILPDGRFAAPYYKPDFSPEQLRNQNYVLHLLAARRQIIDEAGGFRDGFDGAQDHDLLLRMTERTDAVVHVPRILYHWRQSPDSVASNPENKPWAFEAGVRAVREHCERVGIDATVEPGVAPGTYRIRRRGGDTERISVIIPTRGGSRRVWGVLRCFVVEAVRSLVESATHPDIEYVVVYDDVTPAPVLHALRRLAGDSLVLVRYDEPFNFSHKINVGVAASSGELLLILNDDTELIEPASLEVLAAHLQTDDVGMVGPKLLFADGTVQDGGHVYHEHLLPGLVGWHGDSVGPWQLRPLAVEREVSGVTAAAAMVRRSVFDEVGGFDESLPVNFNDVDFSLKIRATGRRVVWTPWASWYHFESQTRPPTARPEEFEAIDARWHREITHDPYYNPNLAPRRSDWVERPMRSGAPMVEPETSTWHWLRQRLFGAGMSDDRSLLTRARVLMFALALAVLVWVETATQPSPVSSVDRLVFTWMPAAVAVGLLAMAVSRRRWVLASGVMLAAPPTFVAELGAGRRYAAVVAIGLVAGVMIGPVSRRSAQVALIFGSLVAVIGIGSWWSMTPTRESGLDPTGSELLQSTGSYVGRAIGGLGALGTAAPTTAVMAWWLGLAALMGVAFVAGVRASLLAPVGALAAIVVVSMLFEGSLGPVEPVGGVFLLSGSIAYLAARVEVPPRLGRRIVALVTGLIAWSWTWSTIAQVRAVAIDEGVPPAWSRWGDWGSSTSSTTASTLVPVSMLAGITLLAFAARLHPRSGDPRGVNVVGYHSITAGLGERTRVLSDGFEAAGVPVARFDLPVESEREFERLADPAVRYDTTVVVAPAFEVERAARAHPELFERRRLVAGYWFWELEYVPATHRPGLDLVDEVWAPTEFVHDAYAAETLRPVRLVPLPIPDPEVAERTRAELGLADDEIVFLVSFSHLSVMERKNPLGAIEAFRRAFPADDDDAARCRLIVKTLNADRKPDDARRLRRAASADDRITIRDERLDHRDLMALVRASDVFVSLHRSEGLGLQIADAMWLGTAVVATDYAGSRDLLDEGCAELVPARPIGVTNGDGAYPDAAVWADPDLDIAAAAMRRLALDPARREELATAARRTIANQPGRADTGRMLASLARCPVRR